MAVFIFKPNIVYIAYAYLFNEKIKIIHDELCFIFSIDRQFVVKIYSLFSSFNKVLFLNTNEQNQTQNTRKTLNGLIEVSQMLRNDETTSNPLQRSKRETTEFGSIEPSQPLQDIVIN